jgi:hypothetical protein
MKWSKTPKQLAGQTREDTVPFADSKSKLIEEA